MWMECENVGTLRRGKDVVSDVSTEWRDNDPVLMKDMIGIETDTGKMKVGDGVKKWSELEYISGGGIDSENWTITEDVTTNDMVFSYVGGV